MEFKCESHLYPCLEDVKKQAEAQPTAPTGEVHIVEGSAHTYRLQKIGEVQKQLEAERDKRANLSKKYHRSVKILGGVDNVLVVSTMGLGVAGIGVLSTIIAAPVAIAMEGAALGAGLLSIIGTQVNKKLMMKAEKHEKIKVLAEAKLNTISDHISKALIDGFIDDSEYSLILSEVEKFKEMKADIGLKVKTVIDEETKKSFIEQGRADTLKNFQEMFTRSGPTFSSFRRLAAGTKS